MINPGLVRRALREIAPTTLLCGGLLASISGLLAFALPHFQARISKQIMPVGFMQMRSAMLGVEGGGGGIAEIAFSIAWAHPVVIILLLTQGIIACTRVPAGEIDRGSIDMLMGLPISRRQLFVSETVAWLIGGLAMLGAVYGGSFVGSRFIPMDYRPDWTKLLVVLGNLGCVYALVSTLAMAASAISGRRAQAILAALVISVGSLLLNFLKLVWQGADQVQFMSFLNYYRPVKYLMNGVSPLGDMAILGGIALGLWIVAGIVLDRRPLTTL